MSYSRSKQVSGKEKQLQNLRLQLYGHEGGSTKTYSLPQSAPLASVNSAATAVSPLQMTTEKFLRHDLLKSLTLATLAIAIQTLLYFLIQRGLIRF